MNFSIDQQTAIDIRNKNVVVSASAGSGKTAVLVERLCQLVTHDRISIDSILAMTFTNDAAAEMKSRLKQALQKKQEEVPEDAFISQQLVFLETASICTIDSFCQSLVKNFYYKIPISYTMAQTVGSSAQLENAFQQAYTNALLTLSNEEVYKITRFFSIYGSNDYDIQRTIQSILQISNAKPDANLWMEDCEQMYSTWDSENMSYFYQFFQENILAMLDILKNMTEEIENIDFSKQKDYDKYATLFEMKKERLEACLDYVSQSNYEMFRSAFIVYINSTDNMPGKINKIDYTSIKSEYLKYQENISDYLFEFKIFEEDLKNNKEIIQIIFKICRETKKQFASIKRELEIIDFNDMEHFALELLEDASIQEELRNKYETILVDEFQDTNELQETIFSKFQRKNNVFRVGDVKQSIYGFRQANPNIMKNHMNQQNEFNQTLVLKENYRSNESIISFNNDFYQKIMNTALLGSQFEEIDIAYVGTSFQSQKKQYPIRFIYTDQETWKENQEEKINAATIKSMHEKNRYAMIANDILKQVSNGRKYSDICVLLRNRAKQEELKECLESYHIPVFASANSGFFMNSAIQIVLSCLNALINPNDDIHLVATLHSPLFNLSMDTLAKACVDKPRNTSLFKHLKNQEFMQPFFQMKRHKPSSIVECIKEIYQYNDFYYASTSEQDKTNLDYLLEKAVNYPYQEDLCNFIKNLENESKLDKTGEAMAFGKEENVVKIMTMHASKGLQFPVVYVLSQSSTSSHFDNGPVLIDSDLGVALASVDHKQKAKRTSVYQIANKSKKLHDDLMEEMRILYVATTRPKEELIFVDTISSEKLFNYELNTRALLNKKSYTSWLFHTYRNDRNSIVQFEKQMNLFDKLEIEKISKTKEKLEYTNTYTTLSSQTASSKKVKKEWIPYKEDTESATQRGTLFHEIVAQCSYPYKEEEIIQFAKQSDYEMRPIDISQILALNHSLPYQKCMETKHQFELSYIVQEGQEVLHGFMDLVAWFDDKIVILDFKTDTATSSQELINTYRIQLETYKESLNKIENSKPIETVIYSFHLNEYIEF